MRLRWLIVGFLSGAVAVIVFHQGAFALLHAIGLTPRTPWSFAPTAPWGIPQLWSLALWGGVWGVLLAAALGAMRGVALIGGAFIFGALFPTLVAWFIVAPLKGQPVAAGLVPAAMLIGPILNGAWGLGTGLGLAWFGRGAERLSGRAERRHRTEPVAHERRRSMALGGFPR
jgi:hypothetical protein